MKVDLSLTELSLRCLSWCRAFSSFSVLLTHLNQEHFAPSLLLFISCCLHISFCEVLQIRSRWCIISWLWIGMAGLFCLICDDAAATGPHFTPHLYVEAWDIVKQHENINDSCLTLGEIYIYSGESWILWAKRDEEQTKQVYWGSGCYSGYWYWCFLYCAVLYWWKACVV